MRDPHRCHPHPLSILTSKSCAGYRVESTRVLMSRLVPGKTERKDASVTVRGDIQLVAGCLGPVLGSSRRTPRRLVAWSVVRSLLAGGLVHAGRLRPRGGL